MRRCTQLPSAECFPTPNIRLRTNDSHDRQQISQFSEEQAEAARTLLEALQHGAPSATSRDGDIERYKQVFRLAERWRYDLAVRKPHGNGRYGPVHVNQFRTPVSDGNLNLFSIGDSGRYREGAVWDRSRSTYVGGHATPASSAMQRFYERALTRFRGSSLDAVSNLVELVDGSTSVGMTLLRHEAAERAGIEIAMRIAARGGDPSRFTSGPNLVYVASPPTASSRATFENAMTLLAHAPKDPQAVVGLWVDVAYGLYQAPQRKRGIDATIRTFLVAVGAHLIGSAPTLPSDLDLLAYVLNQDQFISEVRHEVEPSWLG